MAADTSRPKDEITIFASKQAKDFLFYRCRSKLIIPKYKKQHEQKQE
jgi:hypothetical protein